MMRLVMTQANDAVLDACRERLDQFFASYRDSRLQARVMKALRFLATAEKPLAGKPEGWAAGMIYAVANLDRQACGVPGVLNSDFTEFFGVSMETVRKRAARVAERISV